MKRKVVNFICYENICSGLFKSQVVEGAIAFKLSNESFSVSISVFVRPSHIEQFFKLKSYLNKNFDINLVLAGPLLPLRFINSVFYSKLLINLISFFIFVNHIVLKSSVCVSRGYIVSAGLARIDRKVFIFDPRSVWHLENASAGLLEKQGQSFEFWRDLERIIVKKSKSILVVSEAMRKYFNDVCENKMVSVVPILTHHSDVTLNDKKAPTFQCGYVGSLGLNGVNTEALSKLLQKLIDCGVSKFLFLTNEPKGNVLSLFPKNSEIEIEVKAVEPKEISEELANCVFGIHALPAQLDAHTRMGTKVLEYWNAGIPVIINENVGAAALLINQNPFLGAVIKDSDELSRLCNQELQAACAAKIKNFHSNNFGLKLWLEKINAAIK